MLFGDTTPPKYDDSQKAFQKLSS
ncbi:hypothetical protein BRAS3843_1380057 [Bradyrhizobium sp. STM 3843]|nr:hypothetical protein BRAS3843_1380057 [Bradyrhizobium sp. STM 3843]